MDKGEKEEEKAIGEDRKADGLKGEEGVGRKTESDAWGSKINIEKRQKKQERRTGGKIRGRCKAEKEGGLKKGEGK